MLDVLNKIKENNLSEKEAVEKLREAGFKANEAYEICLQEFKHMSRIELLKATYGTVGDNTPVIGHFDEHGITIFTAEEEKLW